MISWGTNLLFIALEASRPGHAEARTFLESHREDADFALCELCQMELYVLLRNPASARRPLEASSAESLIRSLRGNPRWNVLNYPGPEAGIMEQVWTLVGQPDFTRRRVFDPRLALTLRHHGVTEFATAHGKDFTSFGFDRVWNPLEEA